MNDIDIWQRLVRGEAHDVPRLLADLRALSALDEPRRCAFYALVEPFAGHDDPTVREVAVAFLRGVQGKPGLERLVAALDDGDQRVREAAAQSLLASSVTQPYRWTHAVFHPRAEVRALALQLHGPQGAEQLGAYLRADPPNAALAAQAPWPKAPLPLVVDLFARDAVSAQEVCDFVVAASPVDLADFLARTPDAVQVILRAAGRADEHRLAACGALAAVACRPRQHHFARRLVDSLLRVPDLGDDAVALAAVLDVRVLSTPAMTGDALPAFEWWLLGWRLREQAPKITDDNQLAALLDLPLFRDPDGTPRVGAAAALCSLRPGRPLHTLVRHFGEAAVIESLRAHAEQWDSVCRLPPETPSEALRLLDVMATRDRAIWLRLVANAIARWSSAQNDTCATLLDGIGDGELADVTELLVERVNALGETTAAKAVSHVAVLLRARVRSGDVDSVLARLLTLASPAGGHATRLIDALIRPMSDVDLVPLVSRLTPSLQLQLVSLLENALQLTLSQELAIADVLKDARVEDVRRWAARVIRGAAATTASARPTIAVVHMITEDEAQRIASASDKDLEKALARALAGPTRLLCGALARRPAPDRPALSACAALLACGDPLPEVHDAIERFGSMDADFLSNLDHAAVTLWQGNAGLPPLGHAWLHRWEQHAFALIAWLDGQDIAGRLAEIAALPAGLVRQQLWEALGHCALLHRYRDPPRLDGWARDKVLKTLLAALGEPDAAGVARVLVALVESRFFGDQLGRIRQRIQEVAPDLDDVTRVRLSALAQFEGIPEAARRAPDDKPAPGTIDDIRRSNDPDALLRVCREHNRTLVNEALMRLIFLGPAAGPVFRILAREWPALPCPVPVAESIAMWTDEEAIAIVRALVGDARFSPEARFRAARALVERGEIPFVDDALVAAIVDDTPGWFRPADWGILSRHADPTTCALALVGSPHPHAYQNAVEHLMGQACTGDVAAALQNFLAVGPGRPLHMRRKVARRLLENGNDFGVPVIADQLLDHREPVDVDAFGLLRSDTRDALAATLTTSSLIAGDHLVTAQRTLVLANSGLLSDAAAQELYMQVLELSSTTHVRAEAAQRAQPGPGRAAKLDALARTFAWGVRRGRDLTGRLFRIHMTPKRQDLGYTFLTESRIFVSPLPLLRGDHNAQAIVEGLILHEIGHHMFHAGDRAAELFNRARREGIGPLLNLIADEHLERNLRALDAEHGDRLKRLAAHAFLHASREVNVQTMLDVLLGGACQALTAVPLGVSHDPASVDVQSGTLLRAIGDGEGSFARFVSALRLGHGNRWNDPLIDRALSYFGGGFRRLDMAGLYDVAVAVARLFGGRQAVAELFGGHESIPWSELESQRHGDDISDQEVQREVDRILDPRQLDDGPGRGPHRRFALNVNPKEEFDRIEQIQRLPYDPGKHRPVAVSVRRHAMRLRDFLHRLGRTLVARRARLRGRAFDRTRVRAVVTRRDPRMLIARETEIANDIFVGTIIDCSSSMSAFDNIDKAKRFGVLVAEAVRDVPGIDARFFGFTESLIYDAGDGGRCAVTSMEAEGGNNDAAALFHAARVAAASARRTRVLVMISDGLPTQCSTAALRALVTNLGRKGFICAQVAVHPLEEVCFPNYVVLDDKNLDVSVARFGELIMKLVTRAQA